MDVAFCNEDEAVELAGGSPEQGLDCEWDGGAGQGRMGRKQQGAVRTACRLGRLHAVACWVHVAVLLNHRPVRHCPTACRHADMAQHCRRLAVVTLGEKGCMIKETGADDVVAMPACAGVKVRWGQAVGGWLATTHIVLLEQGMRLPFHPAWQAVDTTGAVDLFAAGFLFGLLNGMDRCGEIGCMAGGAVVQTLVSKRGGDA